MPEGEVITPATLDDVLARMNGINAYIDDKVSNGIEIVNDEVKRLAADLTSAQEALREVRRDKIAKLGNDGRITVKEGRLAGYDALDLAIYRHLMRRKYEEEHGPDGWRGFPMGEAILAAQKSLVESVTLDTVFAWEQRAMKDRLIAYGGADFNPGTLKFRDELAAWRGQMIGAIYKAMDSTTVGSGDELVPTLEASQLWMDVNLDTVVLPVMQQVPMPSSPFDMPTQMGAVNWYPGTENVAAITTDLSTSKITLTAKTLRAGVPWSDELEEDAVIALVPEIRRETSRNAAEVIDDVLLNADTTADNGINSDGVLIATNTAGKAHWLLGFDGLIHLPIIDNVAQTTSHGAGVSADMFNEVAAMLGKYASPKRKGDVVYISDVNTMIRSLSIPEFETVDTAGAKATLSTGERLSVYGIPYLESAQMKLADTDGKVTDSGGNTVGRLLVFNTTQWRVGFRRQITVESDREAAKGQTTIYLSFRIALTERTGTRSSATHTAALYNITGVI